MITNSAQSSLGQVQIQGQKNPKIQVFYDGSCPLCVREIAMLKKTLPAGTVHWLNIAPQGKGQADLQSCDTDICGLAPGDDLVTAGLTRREAMKRFHIRTANGTLLSGAPAFLTLWQHHQTWGRLAKALSYPPLVWGLELAYRGFLFVRPTMQALARRILKD